MEKVSENILLELISKLEGMTPYSNKANMFKTVGELKEVLKKKGLERNVYVDSWPNVSAVVVLPKIESEIYNKKLKYINNTVTCFAKSEYSMKTALSSGIFDWKKTIMFSAFPWQHYGILREVVKEQTGQCMPSNEECLVLCDSMSVTLTDLPSVKLPPNLKLGELTTAHSSYVYSVWKHSSEESAKDYIEWTIETQPSVAVFDSEDKVIAFMIRQYYGSMGMLYVEPNYRKQGLGTLVITELAKKLLASGENAFVHVEKMNKVSLQFHRKCGFKSIVNGEVLWKTFTPKSDCSDSNMKKCCV